MSIVRSPSSKTNATATAIIAAAGNIFLNEGFVAASMDAIARRADVSKATLYAHFASKEALFAAVMLSQREGYERQLEEVAADQQGNFAERITRIGVSLLTFMLSPSKLQMFRVIIAENERIPDICQTFLKASREHSYQKVAGVFRDGITSGQLVPHDADEAARFFVAALRGDLVWSSLLGSQIRPSETEIAERVTAVVQPIVGLYGKRELDKANI